MQPKITVTMEFDNLDFLAELMVTLGFNAKEANFVINNYKPDYKDLIQGFLNKEVTFAQLKKAVR